MALTLSGSNGVAGVDGSAGTPALQGSDSNTGIAFGADTIIGSTGGSERFRCDSSGRLLVGATTAPSAGNAQYSKLVVQGNTYLATDYGILNLQRGLPASGGITGNLGGIHFSDNAGNEFGLIQCAADGTTASSDYPGRLVFSTTADGASSPTERARITNAGYFKADNSGGYVSPTGLYHELSSSNDTAVLIVRAPNANYAATNGALRISIARNTTNDTFYPIAYYNEGAGAIRFLVADDGDVRNTNNSYGAISDINLKENIVEATSQWSDLKALQVRKYNFKEETGHSTHTQIGLIAQEVELVSPGLVTETPDRDEDGNDLGTTTKSVNYSVLYMKAVKALQEAMERIESLETRLAALEVTP